MATCEWQDKLLAHEQALIQLAGRVGELEKFLRPAPAPPGEPSLCMPLDVQTCAPTPPPVKPWADEDETWGFRLLDQRDASGGLTMLALALDALKDNGCDCGEDEPKSCLACVCEMALRELWEKVQKPAPTPPALDVEAVLREFADWVSAEDRGLTDRDIDDFLLERLRDVAMEAP